MTIQSLLADARARLMPTSESATLDAELLLVHVLHCSRTELFLRANIVVGAEEAGRFFALITRRAAGESVAYLIGEKEFFGLKLRVDRRVLVPRPETELIVEEVLAFLKNPPQSSLLMMATSVTSRGDFSHTLLDVGTGSGCIAIALKKNLPDLRVIACDISHDALAVARENAARLGAEITFYESDLTHDVSIETDIVTANLPYVGTEIFADVEKNVTAFEPATALYAGVDGLDLYRRLATELANWKMLPQLVVCECAPGQTGLLAEIFQCVWPEALITIKHDLTGRDRVVTIRNTR